METQLTITAPGVYDIPVEEYHADPCPGGSLSSTGIRKLVNDCPARFHYDLSHPQKPKAVFDFGHVAHMLVLGKGEDVCVVNSDAWCTKAAKEQRDEAREAGRVPILQKDFDTAFAMARVLEQHEFAAQCFQNGKPEQALFWHDRVFDIWCRALLDWMPNEPCIIFTDYKTCRSSKPDDLARAMFERGYYIQAAFYLEGIRELELAEQPHFLFAFQEKEPPFLITVAEPNADALYWGRLHVIKAKETFVECTESGVWPGYADDVAGLDLPGYAAKRFQDNLEAGRFDVANKFQSIAAE